MPPRRTQLREPAEVRTSSPSGGGVRPTAASSSPRELTPEPDPGGPPGMPDDAPWSPGTVGRDKRAEVPVDDPPSRPAAAVTLIEPSAAAPHPILVLEPPPERPAAVASPATSPSAADRPTDAKLEQRVPTEAPASTRGDANPSAIVKHEAVFMTPEEWQRRATRPERPASVGPGGGPRPVEERPLAARPVDRSSHRLRVVLIALAVGAVVAGVVWFLLRRRKGAHG